MAAKTKTATVADSKKSWDAKIDTHIQVIVFRVGAEEYGIGIQKVTEIIHVPKVTRVPKVKKYIKGVINLRGNVIPTVDLATRLRLKQKEYTKAARIIVVETSRDPVGLLVHEVDEVIAIPDDQIESAGTGGANIKEEYISGMGKVQSRLITLLNVDAIFKDDEEETETKK